MAVHPVIEKLPDQYLLLIGEIVTAWALLETELNKAVYTLLDIGPKQGRTAVRTPRAKEIAEMVQELVLIERLPILSPKYKEFIALLDELERRRNQLAHNIWMAGPSGEIIVQNLQGSWPKLKADRHPKKRVDPEGIALTPDNLTDLRDAIRSSIAETRLLQASIANAISGRRERPSAQAASGNQ
jgi:hypothetical protein